MPKKNFYNLPSPWNPGYAIPDSVLDEGLLRRTFTTSQAPRGTYDAPEVSNHGYAVPSYVDEEGYGQGAMVTKWLPRGYYGPNLPHWLDDEFSKISGQASLGKGKGVVLAMQTMSGLGGVDPYSSAPASAQRLGPWVQYGQRSAAIMINQAKRLPPQKRELALKTMMQVIDPTLETRTKEMTARAAAQGVAPQAALAHGLAAAMTEGMLKEIFELGKTGKKPRLNSRLGLSCYGCAAAMGAIPSVKAVQEKYGAGLTNMPQAQALPVLEVGPWKVPQAPNVYAGPDGEPANLWDISKLTDEQKSSISSGLVKILSKATLFGAGGGGTMVNLQKTLGWPNSNASIPINALNGKMPFFSFKHPQTGESCGIFLNVIVDPMRPGAEYKAHPYFRLRWAPVPPSMGVWEFLLWLPSKLTQVALDLGQAGIDSIKTAVHGVSEQGCQVVNLPGAGAAAGVVGGVYGGPAGAAAGVQGTQVAQGACNAGGTPQQLPPPESDSGFLMPAAIIGGGALLILLLNKKKKAS